MDEKKMFIEQMDKLIKYGRQNDNCVTKADVDGYFKGITLTDDQKQLIYNFLYDARIGLDEPFDTDELMDEDDVDFLQMYIDELETVEKLTDKKKRELITDYTSGNRSLKDKLIESYLWDVVETAKLYSGSGVSIEDLIGEGNVALAVIAETLDMSSSAKELDEFITEGIMAAMEELLYEDNNEKSKNNSWAEDANDVFEKAKELAETLVRKVRIEELFEFGDFEREFVENVLQITGGIDIIEGSVNGKQ